MIKVSKHFLKSHVNKYNAFPKKMKKVSNLIYESPFNQSWRDSCLVFYEGLLNLEPELIENFKAISLEKNMNFYLLKFLGDESKIKEQVKREVYFDFSIQNFDRKKIENEKKAILIEPVFSNDLNYLNHILRKIAKIKYRVSFSSN